MSFEIFIILVCMGYMGYMGYRQFDFSELEIDPSGDDISEQPQHWVDEKYH